MKLIKFVMLLLLVLSQVYASAAGAVAAITATANRAAAKNNIENGGCNKNYTQVYESIEGIIGIRLYSAY